MYLLITTDQNELEVVHEALFEHWPELKQWIEDYYWEQVKGEIRGAVYDVAVLMTLSMERGAELLGRQDRRERWSGLTITNVSPLFEAVTGATSGGLIVDAQLGPILTNRHGEERAFASFIGHGNRRFHHCRRATDLDSA